MSNEDIPQPSPPPSPRQAKCLCGGVRFTVKPLALHADACHCTMCQTWHGGAGMSIKLSGPPVYETGRDLVTVYQSSKAGRRCFCSVCGTSLGFQAPDYGYYGCTPGVLLDQSGLILSQEIFVDEKPAYYAFQGEQPTLTGEEFWARISNTTPDKES